MKIFTALFLFLSTTWAFSQTWQVTSIPANQSGQRYDDVFFLNKDIGWAANGYFAAVL